MNYLVIAIAALILAGLSYLSYILLFNKEKITDTDTDTVTGTDTDTVTVLGSSNDMPWNKNWVGPTTSPVPEELQHCVAKNGFAPARNMQSAVRMGDFWLVQNTDTFFDSKGKLICGGGDTTVASSCYTLQDSADYTPSYNDIGSTAFRPNGALTCTPTNTMNNDCVGWNGAQSCIIAGGSVTGNIEDGNTVNTVNITRVGN